MQPLFRRVVVALLLLLAPTGFARAQTGQMFGELVGKVTDAQGGVLPGATVTLSGPALMGTQSAVTNERGQYRFPAVNSGTYKLTFELSGFAPLVRDGIVVPVRSTITVDAQLKIATVQETVTVSGASPTVDVENTKVGGRLDQQTLTAVPTSRTIFGSTTVLPGMTMGRQDPGGLNAATSTDIVAHGATIYNLNYYGVTADTPQNYGSMYYMDYGSAEEISVDTAAMGAEVGGGGGANINVIPKSGGNELTGQAVYSATGKSLAGNNLTEKARLDGITASSSLQKLTDFNANAGGPFVKDRLWWFGSVRNYATDENVAGFPILFNSNLRNYTASTKFQLTKNNQLSGFWTYNKKVQPHRSAGVNQPDPATTIHQESPKNLFNVNYTSVVGQNTFVEVSSSYFHMHWPSKYADEFYALPVSERTSSIQNLTTGIYSGPEPTGERIRDAYRYQTNVGVTRYIDGFLGGTHQLKTGFENWYGWGSDVFDVYNDTRLLFRNDAAGVPQPSEIFAYNTPLTQRTRMRNFAAFAQDRLTYNRFTFNLGVRWSYYDGTIPEQSGGGGHWFPVQTYPEVRTPYSWNTLAPRTGVIWKVTEDGKNVVKAAYSRYYDVMYTGEFNAINQNIISTTGVATYKWFGDLNNNGVVDPGEYDPNPLSVFKPKSNSIDPNLRDPKNDEIMFAYQRELMANVGFNVEYIQRWFADQTVDENIGIPLSAYTPHVFADPGPDNIVGTADDSTITGYDVSPAYLGKDVFFHTNSPATHQYKGLELTVTKRMSDRWQMMGSYVWSRLDGGLVSSSSPLFGDPNNPNSLIDATGRLSYDQPNAFKLIGSYQAPWGINLGANFQALSGLPRDRRIVLPLKQGSTTVLAEPRGTYRSDTLSLLSLRADKSFHVDARRRVGVILELHNALNSSAGQNSWGVTTQSFASQAVFDARRARTSYFGRMQEIVAPRILKLGLKFEF
ncbi:MAG: carboxypeptidase regulatory-like domain-containing protein [Betaproteobacteria bacterium]